MSVYTYFTLNDPSAVNGTYATGINASDQIVGYFVDASGAKNGFVYSGGNYTTIVGTQTYQGISSNSLPATIDSGPNLSAALASVPIPNLIPQGINDAGEIVGYYNSAPMITGTDETTTSFIYQLKGGAFSNFDLGGAGSDEFFPTWAEGINNQNQIVGYLNLFSIPIGAFNGGNLIPFTTGTNLYGFQATALNYPSNQATYAHSVNNQGEVVGNWIGTDNNVSGVTSHGFIYNNGAWSYFDVPGAVNGTFATGINDSNVIVGYFVNGSDITHGFLFNQPTGAFSTFDIPNATNTYLNGINDAGQIVGSYVDSAGTSHGFVASTTAENAINDSITDLYIGYYNRAPDPAGETYWAGRLEAGMSLSQIAQSYSVQTESTNLYPFLASPNTASTAAVQAFVTSVYENLFNRAPDTPGENYWVTQLQTGASTVGGAIINIISGAQLNDLATINNKVIVGDYYDSKIYSNSVQFSDPVALSALGAVTSNASSIATAEAIVDAYIKIAPYAAPTASQAATASQAEVNLVGISPSHDLATVA